MSVVTVAGDLKVTSDIILDDGGSLKEAGGTAALTYDGSGNVTKIGQDSPMNGEFLKWDGFKAVWDSTSIPWVTAPTGPTSSGTAGQIAYGISTGTTYLYICSATNSWRRVALSEWMP